MGYTMSYSIILMPSCQVPWLKPVLPTRRGSLVNRPPLFVLRPPSPTGAPYVARSLSEAETKLSSAG
jgi:hypothetical protein